MADESKIIRIVVDASRAADGSREATRALEALERNTRQATATIDRLEQSLGKVGLYLKANLMIMAADFGARMLQLAKDSLNAAAGLDELAEQLGVTAEGLQALQYSAVQSGVKLEQLETGIGKFSQKMGEAAGGSKEMIEALNGLGVKILDANGKLRPTEALLQNVAEAITSIDDPAKKASAAVDLFGKTGARMLPMLKDMSQGLGEMASNAQRAGAMISTDAREKLDKLADAGERSHLKMRALFAETSAGPLTQTLEFINSRMERLGAVIKAAQSDLGSLLKLATSGPAVLGSMLFAPTAQEGLAAQFAKAQEELNATTGLLAGGNLNNRQRDLYENRLRKQTDALEALQRQQSVLAVSGKVLSDGETGGTPYVPFKPGDKNPTVKGSGEDVAERLRKAMQDSQRELDQAKAFSEVAGQGAAAVENLEIHFRSLKAAQDVFGKAANENSAAVGQLTKSLEGNALAAQKLKNLGDFRAGTQTLRDQVELQEAEVRLVNELPEARARELAVLRTTQEVRNKQLADNKEDIADRIDVLQKGEMLKGQLEQLRQASELWTEPLKEALRSIQSTASDAFEGMLESGKLSFETLGQTSTKVVRKMIAEFLALATVRPVMSLMVSAAGATGLITPAQAAGMGYGGAGGSFFSAPGSVNTTLPSIGGGNIFDSIGDSLSSAWDRTVGFFGGTPAGGYSDVGALINAKGLGGSPGILGSGIGWGQGLGALAGAGMGIYSLMNSKSTGQTIGGIGSLIGAGVSLIPGIGQIAGPAIGLLSSILPGLFGQENPTITNQEFGQLGYGAGGFSTSGGAWGPSANAGNLQGPLGNVGTAMQAIFNAFGGVKNPADVWGVALQSFAQQYGNGNSFSNQTSFLVDPSGNRRQWGQGSNASDIGMVPAGVEATVNSIIGGAVGEISDNMRTALGQVNQSGKGTFETLQTVVTEILAFDDAVKGLDQSANDAKQALSAIDSNFAAIYATATKYGLATGEVDAAKAKQRLDYASSFADSIQRGINDFTDPTINALADLDKWREKAIENNRTIVETVVGSLDQINKIEELYGLQRTKIIESTGKDMADAFGKLTDQTARTIQDAIDRLTLGDLSNLSPSGMFAGQKATYQGLLAQAMAGDANALGQVAGAGTSLAEVGRSYFASGPEYESLRKQIVADLSAVLSGGAPATAANGANDATAQNAAQIAQLLRVVETQSTENADLKRQLAQLMDLLYRQVYGQAA